MILELRNDLVDALNAALDERDLEFAVAPSRIEIRDFDDPEKGEFSTGYAHELAGRLGRSPVAIAAELATTQREQGPPEFIASIENINGYLNYHLDQDAFFEGVLTEIQTRGGDYGSRELGDPDTIVADVSSPNIAKPMHIGHLRNTILSDTLMNILEERGNDVTRDNHIGDWGVPFAGAVPYEFQLTGSDAELEEQGIDHLVELYRRYRTDHEDDEHHQAQAQEWFARNEAGDPEARGRWERFREISLAHFEDTYEELDVDFDRWLGESFYSLNGWNDRIIEQARDLDVSSETDDGAVFIPIYDDDFDGVEHPETAAVDRGLDRALAAIEAADDPADPDGFERFFIVKGDGSTVYGTRDLATIEYRASELDADRSVYVVASEQDDYFQELFVAARKLGYDDLEFKHISYGMIPGMSTRDGTLIEVRTFLDDAREAARAVVEEKSENIAADEVDAVAEKVALATIKYTMVSVSRDKDLHFDLEDAVALQGDTGPYLQYQTTRTFGILENVDAVPRVGDIDLGKFTEDELDLLFRLAMYPYVLEQCEQKYDTAPLATYLMRLAHRFSAFYAKYPVLDAEDSRAERVVLTDACRQVLENGLELLGIEPLERM